MISDFKISQNMGTLSLDMGMKITGNTKVLGLLGCNIEYSLSPVIHNVSFQHLGVEAVYLPLDWQGGRLETFLEAMWQLGVVGFNVTRPYKEVIAGLLGLPKGESINTVYRESSRWVAASTDAQGFARGLTRMGCEFNGFDRVILLGNGGVVTALMRYIGQIFEHRPEIFIFRRDTSRDELHRRLLAPGHPIYFKCMDRAELTSALANRTGETLVVQATSAPLMGDAFQEYSDCFNSFYGYYVDLCYGKTACFLQQMRAKGLPCQDGIPMLIEQARLSQEFWFNCSAPYQVIEKALVSKGQDK